MAGPGSSDRLQRLCQPVPLVAADPPVLGPRVEPWLLWQRLSLRLEHPRAPATGRTSSPAGPAAPLPPILQDARTPRRPVLRVPIRAGPLYHESMLATTEATLRFGSQRSA